LNLLLVGIVFLGKHGIGVENRSNALPATAVWAMEFCSCWEVFYRLEKRYEIERKTVNSQRLSLL